MQAVDKSSYSNRNQQFIPQPLSGNLSNFDEIEALDLKNIDKFLFADILRYPNDNEIDLKTLTPIQLGEKESLLGNLNFDTQGKDITASSVEFLKKEITDEVNFFHVRKGIDLIKEENLFSLPEQKISLQKIIFLLIQYVSILNIPKKINDKNFAHKTLNPIKNQAFKNFFKIGGENIELYEENLMNLNRKIFLGKILHGFEVLGVEINFTPMILKLDSKLEDETVKELKSLSVSTGLQTLIEEFKSQGLNS